MSKSAITENLSLLVEKHISPKKDTRKYWAKEVTFDYGNPNQCRVDYMQFIPINNTVSGIEHGDFYCYEVKSSKPDFLSKHGHNFLGDYNYYVMPEEVYEEVKDLIPYNVGVLVERGGYLYSIKKARRKDRDKPFCEMLLMMYRSYQRDFINE